MTLKALTRSLQIDNPSIDYIRIINNNGFDDVMIIHNEISSCDNILFTKCCLDNELGNRIVDWFSIREDNITIALAD